MEAIRLSHPLSQLFKTTNNQTRTIRVRDRTITVPAGTNVHLSMSALHTHPQYWGEDGLEWKPERFISLPQADVQPHTIEDETVAPDTSTHFLPWAYGQRICPGKRFSQVELVAALAMMFRDHRVDPLPHSGESMEDARNRVFATALEVDHEGKMLFEMKYPEKACLMWSKRSD
jgi:cytochrome P450